MSRSLLVYRGDLHTDPQCTRLIGKWLAQSASSRKADSIDWSAPTTNLQRVCLKSCSLNRTHIHSATRQPSWPSCQGPLSQKLATNLAKLIKESSSWKKVFDLFWVSEICCLFQKFLTLDRFVGPLVLDLLQNFKTFQKSFFFSCYVSNFRDLLFPSR